MTMFLRATEKRPIPAFYRAGVGRFLARAQIRPAGFIRLRGGFIASAAVSSRGLCGAAANEHTVALPQVWEFDERSSR
jgi:hypothetical protein